MHISWWLPQEDERNQGSNTWKSVENEVASFSLLPFPTLGVCVCPVSRAEQSALNGDHPPKKESHYLIFYLKIEFHYFLSLHFYTCQCARVALMRALTLTGWSSTFIHQTTIASGHWGDINWETVSRKPDNPALVLHTTMPAQVKHRFRSFKVKAIGLTMYIMRFTVSRGRKSPWTVSQSVSKVFKCRAKHWLKVKEHGAIWWKSPANAACVSFPDTSLAHENREACPCKWGEKGIHRPQCWDLTKSNQTKVNCIALLHKCRHSFLVLFDVKIWWSDIFK